MENKLNKIHDRTLKGIVDNKSRNRTFAIVFVVCFVSMLVFCGYIYFKTLGLMHVVENNGRYLPTRLERKERLISESTKIATYNANKYTNNINRFLTNEYLARARLYISKPDLSLIVNTYRKNKYYDQAKDQGYEYKNEFVEFLELRTDKLPYFVRFKSKTTVYDGAKIVDEFYVIGEANVTETTPQFEENPEGLYFSNYTQRYVKETKE